MENLQEYLNRIKEFSESVKKREGNGYTLDRKVNMLYVAIEQIEDEIQVKSNREKFEDVWSEIKINKK